MTKPEAIELYCQPSAKKTQVMGMHNGRIKVALASPPVEGQANMALIKFIALALAVRQSDVKIVAGEQSRNKRVVVAAMTADEVRTKLLALVINKP